MHTRGVCDSEHILPLLALLVINVGPLLVLTSPYHRLSRGGHRDDEIFGKARR
jgi:hypothetical protein